MNCHLVGLSQHKGGSIAFDREDDGQARPSEGEAQKARAELRLRGGVALRSLLTFQSHTAAKSCALSLGVPAYGVVTTSACVFKGNPQTGLLAS